MSQRPRTHVVSDLAERFEMVLEAIEKDDGWATNRVTPGKVILGNLEGIEAGVRQMIRKAPLEVAELELPSGANPSSLAPIAACAGAGATGTPSATCSARSRRR